MLYTAAGLNCGWPVFEGEGLDPDYGPHTTVNQDEGLQFRNLIASANFIRAQFNAGQQKVRLTIVRVLHGNTAQTKRV